MLLQGLYLEQIAKIERDRILPNSVQGYPCVCNKSGKDHKNKAIVSRG